MDTIAAVRNRILQLCGEREISINKLATICALPPSSIKNILYGKSQNPKLITIKMFCNSLGFTSEFDFWGRSLSNLSANIFSVDHT